MERLVKADLVGVPTSAGSYVSPTSSTEKTLAEVLADVVHARPGAVVSHFFDDLGADSLVMAQFCARVRKRPDLPSVSMKDIYQHPTISSLATALAPAARLRPTSVEGSSPRCWPTSCTSTGCRSTATSSTTWAPTRW